MSMYWSSLTYEWMSTAGAEVHLVKYAQSVVYAQEREHGKCNSDTILEHSPEPEKQEIFEFLLQIFPRIFSMHAKSFTSVMSHGKEFPSLNTV